MMSTQAKDNLIYQGVSHTIKFTHSEGESSGDLSPLNQLKEQLGVSLSPIQMNSAHWRGYTCGWEIIDDQLYLTRFSSSSFRIYTWDQFLGKAPPDDKNANGEQNLFPPDKVHHKVDWFSGIIVARAYRAENENEHNGWDLEFENGRLIKATSRFVSAPKRLKDYIDD